MANLSFINTIGDHNLYNYSLATVSTHGNAHFLQRNDQSSVTFYGTRAEPVVRSAREDNPQERETTVYNDCKSIDSIAELLRYIWFILIPAGIGRVRRCTQKELREQTLDLVKIFLSLLVFIFNLPAAVVIFCYCANVWSLSAASLRN